MDKTELRALSALKEFRDAAVRCRELPFRLPEAQEAYQRMFDAVIDEHIPVLVRDELAAKPVSDAGLVDALRTAREYVAEALAIERHVYIGPQGVSRIQVMQDDLSQVDAALRAHEGKA